MSSNWRENIYNHVRQINESYLNNKGIPNFRYATSIQILKFEARNRFCFGQVMYATRNIEMKFQDRKTSGSVTIGI